MPLIQSGVWDMFNESIKPEIKGCESCFGVLGDPVLDIITHWDVCPLTRLGVVGLSLCLGQSFTPSRRPDSAAVPRLEIWLWVNTQWYHIGVGAPPVLVNFGGDWDVHWGYGILTHGHMFWMVRSAK